MMDVTGLSYQRLEIIHFSNISGGLIANAFFFSVLYWIELEGLLIISIFKNTALTLTESH